MMALTTYRLTIEFSFPAGNGETEDGPRDLAGDEHAVGDRTLPIPEVLRRVMTAALRPDRGYGGIPVSITDPGIGVPG